MSKGKRAAQDWEAEAARLEGIYFNRDRPLPKDCEKTDVFGESNDAATCAAALFEAIRLYAMRNKPLPPWIGRALAEAYGRYQDGDEPTLDAALGVTRPRKATREARRVDKRTGLSIAACIVLEVHGRYHRHHSALDNELFAAVGKSMNPKQPGGTVRNRYYANREDTAVGAEVAAFLVLHAPAIDISDFLKPPKKPKKP